MPSKSFRGGEGNRSVGNIRDFKVKETGAIIDQISATVKPLEKKVKILDTAVHEPTKDYVNGIRDEIETIENKYAKKSYDMLSSAYKKKFDTFVSKISAETSKMMQDQVTMLGKYMGSDKSKPDMGAHSAY